MGSTAPKARSRLPRPKSPKAEIGKGIARRIVYAYWRHVLLPYQWRWVQDRSRYKIGCWTRQGGKSFAIAFEVFLGAALEGRNQYITAASHRQSIRTLAQVADHARAFQAALDAEHKRLGFPLPKRLLEGAPGKERIGFANGAEVMALPAKPETIRGFTGDVYWDEAAVTADDAEVRRAVFAVATLRDYRIRIMATPFGDQGVYHDIWSGAPDNGWSRHFVPIDVALKEGLRVDFEAVKRATTDPDDIEQEYFCRFLSDAVQYYPTELLRSCLYDDSDRKFAGEGRIGMGVDIARKRHLTAIYTAHRMGGGCVYVPPGLTLAKERYDVQFATMDGIFSRQGVHRAAIDATGLGGPLAEAMVHKHGSDVIDEVSFTGAVKEALVVTGLKLMQQGKLRIAVSDIGLLRALRKIRKFVTVAGNVRYDAEQTKDGHADEAWAVLLAVHAIAEKPDAVPDTWWM